MFRFVTAGESHGEALAAVVEGVPAGLRLTKTALRGTWPGARGATGAAPGRG